MYRLRWYCWAILSGGRCSELRPIYHGCHALTFALAGLSCLTNYFVEQLVFSTVSSYLLSPHKTCTRTDTNVLWIRNWRTLAGHTLRVHSPDGSTFHCVKWPHGRHLESVAQNQKSDSVNRCVFRPIWRETILPNFIPIRFETTEPWAFLLQTFSLGWQRWVAIWTRSVLGANSALKQLRCASCPVWPTRNWSCVICVSRAVVPL